jgi:syntaxin-binding protein 1
MDPLATRVISSALTMYDIMENKVTLVEKLSLKRQPFPDMDVIYLAVPTPEAVQKISEDFESRSKAKYGNVHLFFLESVSDFFFNFS